MSRLSLIVFLAACGEPSVVPEPITSAPVAAQMPDAPPEAPIPVVPDVPPVAPVPAVEGPVRRGIVVETLDAGDRYTYARVDACGQDAWVAGPKMDLEKGQSLEMVGGQVMANFESPSLGRSFDAILFTGTWKISETPLDCDAVVPAAPAGAPPLPTNADLRYGTAVEVKAGAGYTFVKLDVCGELMWVAGPNTPVVEGDQIVMPKGHAMEGFFAKSINETFDVLWMVQGFRKSPTLPDCPG